MSEVDPASTCSRPRGPSRRPQEQFRSSGRDRRRGAHGREPGPHHGAKQGRCLARGAGAPRPLRYSASGASTAFRRARCARSPEKAVAPLQHNPTRGDPRLHGARDLRLPPAPGFGHESIECAWCAGACDPAENLASEASRFCRPTGRQCGCATGRFSGDSSPVSWRVRALARWTAATARRARRRYGGRHTAEDTGALESAQPVTIVPRRPDRLAPLSPRCGPSRAHLTRRSGRAVDSGRNDGRSRRNAGPRLGSVGFEGSGQTALRRLRLLAR